MRKEGVKRPMRRQAKPQIVEHVEKEELTLRQGARSTDGSSGNKEEAQQNEESRLVNGKNYIKDNEPKKPPRRRIIRHRWRCVHHAEILRAAT